MKKLINCFVLFLFVMLANKAFSQAPSYTKDTVLLLNGNIIITNVIDTSFGLVVCKNPKPDKDNLEIENNRVFSIKNSTGESVIYIYDSLIGNDLTVDEMRYYIKGEQDAEKNFKARGALWTNIFIGAAAASTGSFLCPIPPFTFSALTGLPKIRIKHSSVSNLEYLKHDPYILGFERVARGKRRTKSLIGGGIGIVGGLGVFGILVGTGNRIQY